MSKSAQPEIECFYPYILVEPIQLEETENQDGVYIPTGAENSVLEAKVISAPENGQDEIKVGDIVYIKRFSSLPIYSTNYRFINTDEDLMGKKTID